ncbi:MAG: lipopolysaccharide modification acyltransferase, partial [Bowdeniella nasicola]|nr:lipopolysaccharide modification acyltransferase [Bowdeniella nasicola]
SRSIIAGIEIIRDQLAAGTLRDYVVVALAANSYITADNIAEIVDLLGPARRLVLVTGYGPQRLTWIHESNAAIHAAISNETIALADWEAAIAPHPEYLAGDAVHPGAEGAAIYADVITAALAEFSR